MSVKLSKPALIALPIVGAVLVVVATLWGVSQIGSDQLSAADQSYLTVLKSEGIDTAEPKDLIAKGHKTCHALDNGVTLFQLALSSMGDPSLTAREHGTVIAAAVLAYCPKHADSLATFARQVSV